VKPLGNGWIAVDLDGTLIEYHGWVSGQSFGKPVPQMVERVQSWLDKGIDVRIFTARAAHFNEPGGEEHKKGIENLCVQLFGQVLPITNQKDFHMIELWDDRCKQVLPNTGIAVEDLVPQAAKLHLSNQFLRAKDRGEE
jgi:hypothetical protein